jgi:putative aldouronate transport system substrate-binding protein
MEEDRGKISPDYGIVIPGIEVDAKEPIVLQDITQTELAKFDKFRIDEIESKYMPYGEVPFPVLILTNEEVDEIKPITTDLNMYIEEMEAKFITGVEPLSNWPKYIETLEQMNLKRYVEVYQQAYDRWDKQ